MTEPTKTVWQRYNSEQHATQGGVYMLLFKDFSNAPMYVGRAETYNDRFADHKHLFNTGERTFMRSLFINGSPSGNLTRCRSHEDFVTRWRTYKTMDDPAQKSCVWVPTTGVFSPPDIQIESAKFLEHNVIWIVAPIADALRSELQRTEDGIRSDVYAYYRQLIGQDTDWRITPWAYMFGGPLLPNASPPISYQAENGTTLTPHDFFGSLSSFK